MTGGAWGIGRSRRAVHDGVLARRCPVIRFSLLILALGLAVFSLWLAWPGRSPDAGRALRLAVLLGLVANLIAWGPP